MLKCWKLFYSNQYKIHSILTPLRRVSPTRWPKKSVKLTGCPWRRLAMILVRYRYILGGLVSNQTGLDAMLSRSSSRNSLGDLFGQSGWEYKVDRYLRHKKNNFVTKKASLIHVNRSLSPSAENQHNIGQMYKSTLYMTMSETFDSTRPLITQKNAVSLHENQGYPCPTLLFISL